MAIKDKLISEVIFHRLQPLAISKYWALIQQNILEALGGQVIKEGGPARLMAAVQSGQIQVWAALSKDEERPTLVGMVFTQIMKDPLLGSSKLLIYGLNLKAMPTAEAFSKCLHELELYAKASGCYALEAQTVWSGIRKLLKANGWGESITLQTKEL